MRSWRSTAAVFLFALLFIGGFRPMLWKSQPAPEVGLATVPLRQMSDPTPPNALAFLERVRAETKPGETVALAFAPPHDGFSYLYMRANYVLAGRFVRLPGNRVARVVAYWPEGRIERTR